MRRFQGPSGALIVLTILIVCLAIAVPVLYQYRLHRQRAREVDLQKNLWTLRQAIDFYTMDRTKPPSSLQELVLAKYLREIPVDPICNGCPWSPLPSKTAPGVGGVNSTAPGRDASGKPYKDY